MDLVRDSRHWSKERPSGSCTWGEGRDVEGGEEVWGEGRRPVEREGRKGRCGGSGGDVEGRCGGRVRGLGMRHVVCRMCRTGNYMKHIVNCFIDYCWTGPP